MVHALKNLAIRIWFAAATGGLSALGLLAVFGSPLKPGFNIVFAALLVILAYLAGGWIFNRIAALRLQVYVQDAADRERAGKIGEAAEAFHKAVTLFDSFLVSPLFRRRLGRDLPGRIARFHIARAVRSPEAEAFISSYLSGHPEDAEVAEYWLQHARLGDGADSEHLALADRIAAAQPDNPEILAMMSQVYLARGRTDYTALQNYKRLLQAPGYLQNPLVTRLADLFLRERRADELALEAYLKAHGQDPDHEQYLAGLAACMGRVRENERNASLLEVTMNALARFDESTLRQWQQSFYPSAAPAVKKEAGIERRGPGLFYGFLRSVPAGIAHAAGSSASGIAGAGKMMRNFWKESPRFRQLAKWTIVGAFAAVVFISGISTVLYVLETREPPKPAATAPSQPVMASTGRYTIQIGSFRNRAQAMRFSERMRQLGYPAYWGESRVSEEDVWYYVRISRFEDKTEAKAYGDELKGKGVIDDFYVTNYKEP